MSIFAVLIDIVSIQKYVFGSNKLKENIGASSLVQEVYERYLQDVILEIFQSKPFDLNAWKKEPHKYLIKEGLAEFEVGYVGGGNALLFFIDKKKAETFIKEWTTDLLAKVPGLVTAVALDSFNLDHFESENKKIFKVLQENKYRFIPQTIISRHGITAECPRTGCSMEIWNEKEVAEEQGYVSSVSYAKIGASKKAAEKRKLEEEFENILGKNFCFTDELDKLGQLRGEDSHLAIVHIDGNEMGKRFRETETLSKIRNLSNTVNIATRKSFDILLSEIVRNFKRIQDVLGYDTEEKKNHYPEENNKKCLPLRPVIIGGDDITFVCDGKLGVYFAKIFLEAFESQEVSDEKNISASAGIAITKTKYPFYRGYELSDDLCKGAKKRRKEKPDDGSWLDFHIAYGGFSGSLEEIRRSHYKTSQGDLNFGPYKIGDDPVYGFNTLVENMRKLKKDFPKSKLKELRQVLTRGKETTQSFVKEMEARGKKLPEITGSSYEKSLFDNSKTPYFDMVELMEFYPRFEFE